MTGAAPKANVWPREIVLNRARRVIEVAFDDGAA